VEGFPLYDRVIDSGSEEFEKDSFAASEHIAIEFLMVRRPGRRVLSGNIIGS